MLQYRNEYEDSCAARIGLLHLDSAHCFVLDHADASIGMQLSTEVTEKNRVITRTAHGNLFGYVM